MKEILESELYEPFRSYLFSTFQVFLKSNTGHDFFHAKIVADANGANAGRWMTPDLISISVWRPSILPNSTLTVRSFELKRASQCDITSVHQALAHSRFADFVYLVAPLDDARCPPAKRREIEKQCLMNGVGLFWIRDQEDVESYYQPVRPIRKSPNPLSVDEFLENKLDENEKQRIRSWGRAFREAL